MNWFKRNDDAEVLGLCDELTKAFAVGEHEAEVLPIAPPTILDRTATSFSAFLNDARANEARLVNERAELDARYAADCAANDELLRQTRLVIKSVAPALAALDDGYDPAGDGRKSYEAAIAAKKAKRSKTALAVEAAE